MEIAVHPPQPRSASLTTLTVLLCLVLDLVSGAAYRGADCPSPNTTDPSLGELLYRSDLVVLGKVVNHYASKVEGEGFTAELGVICVFKGEMVSQKLNVSGAGKVSTGCFDTEFTVGMEYLAYLKNEGQRLVPAYPHNPGTYKDEMFVMCDMNVSYPVGLNKELTNGTCEDPADSEDYDYDPSLYDDYGDDYEAECVPAFVPKEDEQPAEPGQTGKVEDDNSYDNDGNGSAAVRMSLSLALSYAFVLLFS